MPPSRSLRRSASATVGLAVAALCVVPVTTVPAAATPLLPAASPRSTSVKVSVPSALDASPFSSSRSLTVPEGWKVSVWARPQKARLLAFTPDDRLLVSRPEYGIITRLTPNDRGRPTSSTLLRGLRQPHGMAFDGSTLYVAESNRVDAYTYANGKATNRRTVLDGLPDSKSKDLKGAYAHALKSLAVGPDHALYVSIGSTQNVSPGDRSENPQRASVYRVPPGGGQATVFARGVRNGTGLAVAPDGALWTAVNNRDNIAYPYHQDYGTDGSDDYGKVMKSYVNDHPMEPLAKLTAGRDLGWPYCNPDPDVEDGVRGTGVRLLEAGLRPRRADQRRRLEARLRRAAQDRAGPRRPLRPARPELLDRRRRARGRRAGRGPRLLEPDARRVRPRSPSSRTPAVSWATSRRWSAAGSPRAASAGAAPSPRSRARTARST